MDSSEKHFKLIKCDFCSSDKQNVLLKSRDYFFNKVPGEFLISKCLDCDLVFTSLKFNSEKLKDYYSQVLSYENQLIELDIKHRFSLVRRKDILTYFFKYPFLKNSWIKKLIQFPNYIRIKKKWKKRYIAPPYIENGKILEIGCSYGSYLYQLKNLGWNTKGLDLNKNAVNYAINELKLDVENKSLEDFHSNELFDIIYMLNVLEHTIFPKEALKKCYSLLKSNGKLVLSVPDFSGIEVRIYRKYAFTLQLPFHLYHFTPITIKKYLKEINFKKIKIIHQASTRDLIAPLSYILADKPNKKFIRLLLIFLTQKLIRNTLLKIISDILGFIGISSRMTVIAYK